MIALALGLLSLVALVANHPGARVPDEDAGVFLYVATRVLGGGMPYSDVWDHKPPLIYYLDALGLALTPGSLDGVWVLEVLAVWVSALLLFATLRNTTGRGPALFGAAALVLSVPRFVLVGGLFTNFTELFGLPLQAAALYLFARKPAWGLPLGIVGGLTFALKPPLLGVWVVVVLVLLVQRRSAMWLFTVALGAALAPAGMLAYFAARGAAGDLFDQVIRYNSVYVSNASLADRYGAIVEGTGYAMYAWLPVAAAAGAGLAMLRLVRERGAIPPIVVVAVGSLILGVPLAGASGNAYGIYALPWLPPLAALAAHAAAGAIPVARAVPLPTFVARRRTAAILLAALVVMAIRPAGIVRRGAATPDDGTIRAAVAYLRENTSASDTVLVWGSHSEVLVLAGRLSPTRFVYQYAPLYTVGYRRAELTEELIRDIERRRPAVILDATRSSPMSVPLAIEALPAWDPQDDTYALPPGIDRLIERIRTSYRASGTVADGWTVYRPINAP